jgi:replicative DNA helicase
MSNTPAEFNLLAGLCCNPQVYFELAEFLALDDFTQKAHKQFFIVLQRLLMDSSFDSTILVTEAELLAKAAELSINDFYQLCDNGELIRACIQHKSSEHDTKKSFVQVKRETTKRIYQAEFKKLAEYIYDTNDGVDKIVATVEDKLIDTNSRLQGVTESPVINLAHTALDILEDLARS